MVGSLALQEVLVLAVVAVLELFWIWMLVDCALRAPRESKVLWIVVIAVGNVLGAAAYLVFGRPSGAPGPLTRQS